MRAVCGQSRLQAAFRAALWSFGQSRRSVDRDVAGSSFSGGAPRFGTTFCGFGSIQRGGAEAWKPFRASETAV